jgi:2-amino-4-hydroxy-6-hydroxymethyldihydropteridine diphosphokinase
MDVIATRYKISSRPPSYFIALGANLPGPDGASPRAMCERALLSLRNVSGLRVVARSRWFSTAPIPEGPQPRYINGVVRLSGRADPADLLEMLHDLERQAGRVRGLPNAARPLDLDIIDMDGLVRAAPHPVLPHPRAHLRAFVLLPLRDVAPDWVHPVLGLGIASLLRAISPQDVRPA